MSLSLFLNLLLAFFKFPKELEQLIGFLQETPAEKHQELIDKINAEKESFQKTGRPSA